MSEPNVKSINLEFLTSMTAGNKEKMSKYINMFLQHAPGLVTQLDANLQAADWSALKTTAHTLKSQFSYMGAAEAQSLALEIEKNSGSGTNPELVAGQVEKIKSIFRQATDELKAELTRL